MTTVYMTVQGRSQDTTSAIARSRARLGVESSNDWIDGYAPQFIDFPFTDPGATFADHRDVVRATAPALTVAPDVENGRELDAVVQKADELHTYARNVVVVPKTVHPGDVPDRFRVGVPLADFGSGAPWPIWAYKEAAETHLLGGGPARQLSVGNHLGNIASVDTATLGQRCRFGYWDGKSRDDAPADWDYEERLRRSLDNYAAAWNGENTAGDGS